MRGEEEIAHGIASDVPMGKDFVPRLKIPLDSRTTIEGHYKIHEHPLADDGHPEPKPGRCFQGGVRNGIQPQPAGRYSFSHSHSPMQVNASFAIVAID